MADQYYRFFPGDYQRDTGDLTLVEHGAYRVLLDHYYTCGPLPSEMDRLYRLCRAFSTEEQTAVSTVVERFFQPNGNRLRNRKADKELSEREAFIEMQREKGRKSAEVRAERKKEQEDNSTVAITDVPTTVQPELQPEGNLPSPSPSPIKDKKNLKEPTGQDFILPSFDEILFSSGPKTKSDLQKVCKQLYGEKTFPEVYAFSNTQLKAKMNPKAVIHALARCVISKPKEPWGYCQKIIAVENGNYNERDNV
jgi:uncharacterized protein YdaU (DUF1376 family)